MNAANSIVKALLEDDFDGHVKAHARVKKWDQAHDTYQKLSAKKREAAAVFQELGQSIGYERALAKVGLSREDVSHTIAGAQIGSIDNYRKTHPAKQCQREGCSKKVHSFSTEHVCPTCEEPMSTIQTRMSFTDLHGKYGQHIVGVETNDGRRVWFDEPVAPRHTY